MTRFNVSAKALVRWFVDEQSVEYSKQSDLMKILRNQDTIRTIGYKRPLGDFVADNDISTDAIAFTMSMAYNVKLKPDDEFLSELQSEETSSKVLERPNDIYFLDVEEDFAENIEKNYGVIFRSTKKPINTEVFTQNCYPVNFINGKCPNGGWKELFSVQSQYPSNSLCIIDRNLFVYDGSNNRNEGHKFEVIYNGLDTILHILFFALPNEFKDTYHVTVLCDKSAIKNRCIFQTLQTALFERVEAISKEKGYPIRADIFAIDDKVATYTHSITHNRQILSNYYKMEFANGINAIRFYPGKTHGTAEYKQKVQAELLYHSCLDFLRAGSPCKDMDETIRAWRYVTNRWKTEEYVPDHYKYADNLGNSSIRNFKNRLFS